MHAGGDDRSPLAGLSGSKFKSDILRFQASSSSHLSKSTRVLSNSQVRRVWTISRFAKLKEKELLYLVFMLGFFYGSHRKNEENFEFLQEDTKVSSRAIKI